MGNVVPLAITNLFQCNIIIYTSLEGMEVLNIEPSLLDETYPPAKSFTSLQYAFIIIIIFISGNQRIEVLHTLKEILNI